jgi:hypothetical protein
MAHIPTLDEVRGAKPIPEHALPPFLVNGPKTLAQDLGLLVHTPNERILKDDSGREQYPLYDGLFAYFPAILCEISRWSMVGNIKHNGAGSPLHWAREKSTDHENKILRHLIDARQVDANGFVEAVALGWRALALGQTILEERGWAEGPNARRHRVVPR